MNLKFMFANLSVAVWQPKPKPQELMKSMGPYIVNSIHVLLTSCIGAPNYYQVTFC
jgi:hypothetical protein